MIWVLSGNEFLILKQIFVKDVKNVVLRQFARWELPKYRIRNYILMKMSVFTVVDVWETADSITDGTYGFKIFVGGRWGKKISHGRALSKVFTTKDEAMDVIEKAILLFRERGLAGERFAVMIDRIGFETVEKALLRDDSVLERKEEILSREL